MDPLEAVALVRSKRGLSTLPNPMFIEGGALPAEPPGVPELSPEEEAIMRDIEDDRGSEAVGAPDLETPVGQTSPPSPLIPAQYRKPEPVVSQPEPEQLNTVTLPASDCMVSGTIGIVQGQGTTLTDMDVDAIKLIILRRAHATLQEQMRSITGGKRSKASPVGQQGHEQPSAVQAAPSKKRGRGRPKGSKNKPKQPKEATGEQVGNNAEAVG